MTYDDTDSIWVKVRILAPTAFLVAAAFVSLLTPDMLSCGTRCLAHCFAHELIFLQVLSRDYCAVRIFAPAIYRADGAIVLSFTAQENWAARKIIL